MKSILVIEDEGLIAMDLKRRLESYGYEVPHIGSSADEALALAQSCAPDLILMDIRLRGEKDGISAAQQVREKLDIPVIFVTAHADAATLDRAKNAAPFGYVVKPFGSTDLRAPIEMAHYKHHAEKKLRRSQAWFSSSLRNIADAVITTGIDGTIDYLNPAAEALTGWTLDQAKERPVVEVFAIVDPAQALTLNPVIAVLDSDSPGQFNAEYLLHSRAGTVVAIECSVAANRNEDGLLGAVIVFRDVTARRQFEANLRQKSKMDALAAMAGSLAHDFNNLLMVVLGYTEILDKRLGLKVPELAEIRKSSQLAASLSRQLLTVSRREITRLEVLDLNEILQTSAKMMQHVLGFDTVLKLDLTPSPLPMLTDRGLVGQILLGLATRAKNVMPRGGVLAISTIESDAFAELVISDSGASLNPLERERAFDPFFTGKSGLGSGLEMTIAHSLVTQLCGTVSVHAGAPTGSVFRIALPLYESEIRAVQNESHPLGPESLPFHPDIDGFVLLVDDNPDIRRLLHNELEALGLRVIAAESGKEARDLIALQPEPPALLITDVMMPGMIGTELARRCAESYPDLRVIFVSGYPEDNLAGNDLIASGRAKFISKPVTPRALAECARSFLAPLETSCSR